MEVSDPFYMREDKTISCQYECSRLLKEYSGLRQGTLAETISFHQPARE